MQLLGGGKVGKQGLGPLGLSEDSLFCLFQVLLSSIGYVLGWSGPALVPESLLFFLLTPLSCLSVNHPTCPSVLLCVPRISSAYVPLPIQFCVDMVGSRWGC